MTEIVLIRHAETEGNLEKKYVGRTDEPLCGKGRDRLAEAVERGDYPRILEDAVLFVSPMRRCIETASLLYPGREQIQVEDFRECDFGDFEYRNHSELDGDPAYQAWIDSGGKAMFPGGERPADFRNRSVQAFVKALELSRGLSQILFVVHGGTIMSVLSAFGRPQADYYEWMTENGRGYVCLLMEDRQRFLKVLRKI